MGELFRSSLIGLRRITSDELKPEKIPFWVEDAPSLPLIGGSHFRIKRLTAGWLESGEKHISDVAKVTLSVPSSLLIGQNAIFATKTPSHWLGSPKNDNTKSSLTK